MKAKCLSLMSASLWRAMVVEGDWGLSKGFWDCCVKKVSLGMSEFVHVWENEGGHAYSDTKNETRQQRRKGQFVFVIVQISPWCSHIINLNLQSMDEILLPCKHKYWNIGSDISRPVELVLVAVLWLVGETRWKGGLLKGLCCTLCAIWIHPLGQDVSRLKWKIG